MPQAADPDRDGTVTSFWWIRHAPVDPHHRNRVYGQTDIAAVTDDQATFAALARQLPADAVWLTTPLQRTRQTRDAIAAAAARLGRQLPTPAVEPGFIEQDFGTWTGMTYPELSAAKGGAYHRFWLAPAHQAPPGGESFAALAARVAEAIERHSQAHRGSSIVVVAHGGPIRAAVGHALRLDPERMLGLSVSTLSLTRLDRIDGASDTSWRVATMNAVPYTA